MTNPTLTEKDVAEIAATGTEARLAYLIRYHEITQSLIGVAKMVMTPEQRAKIAVWDDALDVLQVSRWLALGVPAKDIGENAMFYASNSAVAEAVRNHLISTPNMPKGDRA